MNNVNYVINLDSRPDRLALFHEQSIKLGIDYERIAAIPGGMEGCRKSHLQALARAEHLGLEFYRLFEDDVEFHPDFNNLIDKPFSELPPDWDVFLLGASYGVVKKHSESLVRVISETMCLHAVVVRNTFYKAMRSALEKPNTINDVEVSKLYKDFKVFGCNPILAWQRSGYSDIEGKVVDYSKHIRNLNL